MKKSMKLGGGGRFKKVSGSIKREYEKKGYDAKQAAKIADATAYEIGAKKHGASKMHKLAAKGRKK